MVRSTLCDRKFLGSLRLDFGPFRVGIEDGSYSQVCSTHRKIDSTSRLGLGVKIAWKNWWCTQKFHLINILLCLLLFSVQLTCHKKCEKIDFFITHQNSYFWVPWASLTAQESKFDVQRWFQTSKRWDFRHFQKLRFWAEILLKWWLCAFKF